MKKVIYLFFILLFSGTSPLFSQLTTIRLDSVMAVEVDSARNITDIGLLFRYFYDSLERGTVFENAGRDSLGNLLGGERYSFHFTGSSPEPDTMWVQEGEKITGIGWEPKTNRYTYNYDNNGNLATEFYEKSTIDFPNYWTNRGLTAYHYNAAGKLASLHRTSTHPTDRSGDAMFYSYYPNGKTFKEIRKTVRITNSLQDTSYGPFDSLVYVRDNSDMLIQKYRYNYSQSGSRWNLIYNELYSYDSQGRLSELKSINRDSTLRLYSYNLVGELHREQNFRSDNNGQWKKTGENRFAIDHINKTFIDSTFHTNSNGVDTLWGYNEMYFDDRYDSTNLNLHSWLFYEYNFYYRPELGKLVLWKHWNGNGNPTGETRYYYSPNPGTTSIENHDIRPAKLTVAPNPAEAFINIHAEQSSGPGTISVFDMQGRLLIQQPWQPGVPLPVAGLPAGQYSVRLVQKRGTSVARFIKQ